MAEEQKSPLIEQDGEEREKILASLSSSDSKELLEQMMATCQRMIDICSKYD